MPPSHASSPVSRSAEQPPLARPVCCCVARPAQRFDSLALSAGANDFGWTDGGSLVPAEKSIADAFARLFAEEGAANKAKVLGEIGRGKSILDHVLDEARDLESRLSKRDREKLGEYFETVRATEKRLVKSEGMDSPQPSPR